MSKCWNWNDETWPFFPLICLIFSLANNPLEVGVAIQLFTFFIGKTDHLKRTTWKCVFLTSGTCKWVQPDYHMTEALQLRMFSSSQRLKKKQEIGGKRNEVTSDLFTKQEKTKAATQNGTGQIAMFQLAKRLHYHSAGTKQYISRADHWISRLAGKEIWSIMKEPIDFRLLICRTWHKANGNFPPCAHWLNVILFLRSKHTYHLFSIFPGWHLGIWDTIAKCSRKKPKQSKCTENNLVWLGWMWLL